MAFEILYDYCEAIPGSQGEHLGGYDKDNLKTKSLKVGEAFDEIPVEILAGKVMALLARRNILVSNIQIFEIEKKKISFKEAEDGILIKNRKFKFDDGAKVSGEVVEENSIQKITEMLAAHPELLQALKNGNVPASGGAAIAAPKVAANLPGNHPIRYEFYNPLDQFWVEQARKSSGGFALTKGKKYPILAEVANQLGMIYTVVDDNGKRVKLNDKLFSLQMSAVLNMDGEKKEGLTDSGLVWSGGIQEKLPELRR